MHTMGEIIVWKVDMMNTNNVKDKSIWKWPGQIHTIRGMRLWKGTRQVYTVWEQYYDTLTWQIHTVKHESVGDEKKMTTQT